MWWDVSCSSCLLHQTHRVTRPSVRWRRRGYGECWWWGWGGISIDWPRSEECHLISWNASQHQPLCARRCSLDESRSTVFTIFSVWERKERITAREALRASTTLTFRDGDNLLLESHAFKALHTVRIECRRTERPLLTSALPPLDVSHSFEKGEISSSPDQDADQNYKATPPIQLCTSVCVRMCTSCAPFLAIHRRSLMRLMWLDLIHSFINIK